MDDQGLGINKGWIEADNFMPTDDMISMKAKSSKLISKELLIIPFNPHSGNNKFK